MFKATRRKLTMLYAGLFFCLLVAFAAIIVTGSTWLFLNELKQEIHLLAHEEVEEQIAVYRIKGVFIDSEEENEHNPEGLFYCVSDNSGAIVSANTPSRLQPPVMEAIRKWQEPAGATKVIKTSMEDRQTVFFLLTAEPILDEPNRLGTVYFGKDVTSYYILFCRILIGLAATLLLFLLLALGVGHLLSGRAMTPIVQSFARQREFTADASHELRTPLSIILASADVIQGDKGTTLSPFAQQVLDDMREEIRKMTKLVRDLLTMARGDGGTITLQKTAFDLHPVAEQVIRTLEPLVQDKGLYLSLATPASLFLTADEARIRQLLFILIDNAVKYTPPGGNISLTLEADEVRNGIRIITADTGIGIASEEQKKIFDRFYRSDKARSRDLGGTGLGLAIAVQIVSLHNGTISIASTLGKGATFTVFLPRPD
ncbi:MAG: integral rane sensor signal transduction histidine kinase [Firmicutes bacterium]|nr:integral rane sensor signal transduction histidine kinase [Bacillota bacterium]